MGLEAAAFLDDLNTANPATGDPKSEGDDHFRLMKTVLKNTFPGLVGRFSRWQAKTGAYTAVVNDNWSLVEATGALTLNLTAAATLANGWTVLLYSRVGAITIDPAGAETVNGVATLVLPVGYVAILAGDGTKFVCGVLQPGAALLLSGGTLTGDVSIIKTAPEMVLDAAGTSRLSMLWRRAGSPVLQVYQDNGGTLNISDAVATNLIQLNLSTGDLGITGKLSVDGQAISSSTSIATPAATTAKSSTRFPHGSAPTSPVDGDVWTTTAGLFVRINGATVGPINTALIQGTEQLTTSGTEFDFTGIPAATKKIIIAFNGISLSAGNSLLVQIGDAGGIEITGYTSNASRLIGSGVASVNSATGFIVVITNPTFALSGTMTLVNVGGNTWVSSHAGRITTDGVSTGGGTKTLSATLDRVRITRDGTDTFNAGSVNILTYAN